MRLLQAENGRSVESAGHLLTDQVLEVDRQLLQVARSTLPVEISGVWRDRKEDGGRVGETIERQNSLKLGSLLLAFKSRIQTNKWLKGMII